MYQNNYSLQDKMNDIIDFLAKMDGDTLHYGQELRTPDIENFRQTMNKEFINYCGRKKWEIIPIEKVPKK